MRTIRFLKTKPNVDFMRWRIPAISGSIAAILLSFVLLFYPGFNYGIDFAGGIMIEVRTPSTPDLGQMRTELGALGLGPVALQEFGGTNDVLIRMPAQEAEEAQQAAVLTVQTALREMVGEDISFRRIEFVGPKVSGELVVDGLLAIGLTMLAVLVYIWFRFEWQYGVGAVLALVHDISLTIGLFALLQMEVNLTTVAAVLTIVGYSLNDTVVIFDRIRENLRKYKKMEMAELLNLSINETMARTIMTAVTTLIALFCLFFFGGEVIKGFTFAMIWGIVVGTYSSIYVAAPVLHYLNLRSIGEKKANRPQPANERLADEAAANQANES